MTLWTAKDAAAATGGRIAGNWDANGVSIDTRTIAPGDLFVALKAARDGHDFVAQALANGAAAALVSRVPEGVDPARLLVVDDVQAGLERLGEAARARTRAQVVGVTGSVGKTSTKEMLRTVLGAQGTVHAAEKSYNNHWGVPLTLARMPADVDFAVIEIGMNHPGEIAPLSRMARPHVAMVTIVAPAHLAAFDSIEGIAREKGAIFEGLEPGGTAVINGDLDVSPILAEMAAAHAAQVIDFGEAAGTHHRLTEVTVGDTCTVAQGRAWRTPILFKVAVPGRHFALNGLGVLAVAHALGLDRALAIAALGRWHPGAGRGQREVILLDPVETHLSLELIDDAYNANPASLGASLEVLAGARPRDGLGRVAHGRRICYIGDMKELGREEIALHRALADHPSMRDIDVVHCVGPLMRELWRALPQEKRGHWTESSDKMAARVRHDLDAGDVVLVKGSLSMALARVVDAIRRMGVSPAGGNG
ncbi:MAG: UDP-N-acetylmuramoyl-tripeptide--D-alanyl-D-alanine ligase [Rhodobacteraceae bacterium]|uniref:UDP-N-acetylmuramoyl-tripeptide--D-alanyl-D-alanine ligase n=1 Tax=Salipiger profundus TaxID=1229727 RepID=A0A1U7DC79_9RHOB|nr:MULTISPECIES: UDP-N-acetylmuramoyl-tripeptide--D-alanyl-D-alanine ligase [Salipiger]APX25733.1 UDP-N-acetylmuramoyl-tripeptide--D-alanyl-D-alanine ligase [Salipiger profundus]MAB06408.1 UDP-N-acetylmuramoyl-tripeptide--D-alanyl-D-alanine ligase [Paracoccaceae bacterium]GGA03768.1 UDP-N-acetylmuramoyl-tripeptide--D-alanyl-D-alanine ligase [Salipiger profundus]SFD57161.1 UDP-N-acetylmuramoyl-tripeptide--D-alanyl-D-alanine ligase [Salipiger profundus]